MAGCLQDFPDISKRLYQVVAFDWDGTAVTDRAADASEAIEAVTGLLELGVKLVVITGTNFGNIDRQFSSQITSPHKTGLFICSNRGSEVYGFDEDGNSRLIYRREATPEENTLLDSVAESVKQQVESGSHASLKIVYDRLNRRKIDLNPDWPDPPKSRLGELIEKTEQRLGGAGFAGGIAGVFQLATETAARFGLRDARITSDVKHIEVGLTDKSDSMKWMLDNLVRPALLPLSGVLVAGDEFGPVAGFPGSDFHMVLPDTPGITYVTVGKEPNGVPPEVLLAGGGPPCFIEILRRQAWLRRQLEPGSDPSFKLLNHGFNRLREREVESVFTVSNGYLGTRGSVEEQSGVSGPATLVAGVYDTGGDTLEELVIAPDWVYTKINIFGHNLRVDGGGTVEHLRELDMEKGILRRKWRYQDKDGRLTTIRFTRAVSMSDRHSLYLKISITPHNYSGDINLVTGFKPCTDCRFPLRRLDAGRRDGVVFWSGSTLTSGIRLAMAQKTVMSQDLPAASMETLPAEDGYYESWRWPGRPGTEISIEKYVSVFTSRDVDEPVQAATARANENARQGEAALLVDHVQAWGRRWHVARVNTDGEQQPVDRWMNFAAYHLTSAANPDDERNSISARALTGAIYRGHIFWDTEIFILPFLIFTWPRAARAVLMYRHYLLPQARENARVQGLRGANFPWESALSGRETTPKVMLLPGGNVITIRSGELEEHITAAVAHGVCAYLDATGDTGFLLEAGAELVIETARYWASRAEKRPDGYHIFRVEGPDEYHEQGVDDNFYTNAMAVWNLERGLRMVEQLQSQHPEKWSELAEKNGLGPEELDLMREVAATMYLDMQREDGLIEQFDGYFGLEDINVHDYEPRTAPVNIIMGTGKAVRTQLVKQADVVMALYLLEERFGQEQIASNFEYYDLRTGHGSSLSPSIYGLVAARLGKMERAIRYFRRAAQIDLADNMGNAAGGVHLAALGGLWQQMVMGFAGVRVQPDGLFLLPHVPAEWQQIVFRLIWKGILFEFNVAAAGAITVSLEGEGTADLGILGMKAQTLDAGKTYTARLEENGWSAFGEEKGS